MSKLPEMRDEDGAVFAHPGDKMDAAAAVPEAFLALLADKLSAADIFRRLFADCMPKRSPYRGGRRWRAGYRRMVAICFSVAPELFNGMSQGEVADSVEMHVREFRKLQRDVEAQLAARAAAQRHRAKRQ